MAYNTDELKLRRHFTCHSLEEAQIPGPVHTGGKTYFNHHCLHCGDDCECQTDCPPNKHGKDPLLRITHCCAWVDLKFKLTRDDFAKLLNYQRHVKRLKNDHPL